MLVPLAQELRAEGLEQVLPMVLEGDPAGEIIDLANTTPNSLIAMSTRQIRYRALDAGQRRRKSRSALTAPPCFSSGRLETHPSFSIASLSAWEDSRAV